MVNITCIGIKYLLINTENFKINVQFHMKLKLLSISALSMILAFLCGYQYTQAQSANFQKGISLNADLSSNIVTFRSTDLRTSGTPMLTLKPALVINYWINPYFSVHPGLAYNRNIFKVGENRIRGTDVLIQPNRYRVSFIDVPVMVRIHLEFEPGIDPYFIFGGTWSTLIADSVKDPHGEDDLLEFNNTNISLMYGAGYQIGRISFEFLMNTGLLNITTQDDFRSRTVGFELKLSYRLI